MALALCVKLHIGLRLARLTHHYSALNLFSKFYSHSSSNAPCSLDRRGRLAHGPPAAPSCLLPLSLTLSFLFCSTISSQCSYFRAYNHTYVIPQVTSSRTTRTWSPSCPWPAAPRARSFRARGSPSPSPARVRLSLYCTLKIVDSYSPTSIVLLHTRSISLLRLPSSPLSPPPTLLNLPFPPAPAGPLHRLAPSLSPPPLIPTPSPATHPSPSLSPTQEPCSCRPAPLPPSLTPSRPTCPRTTAAAKSTFYRPKMIYL
jgi:hypothetical protein